MQLPADTLIPEPGPLVVAPRRGLTPVQWVRIAIPLVGGVLGAVGLVMGATGRSTRTLALVSGAWLLVSAVGSTGAILSEVEAER